MCPWRCEQRTVGLSIVCLANALTSSLWIDSTRQDYSLLGTAFHVSTNGTARDQISQGAGLPPPYFILEAIKYWWWERPGNEANGYASTEKKFTQVKKLATEGLIICAANLL